MNVVMTGDGRLVEVQATAEGEPFSRDAFDELLALGERGVRLLDREAGGSRCRRSCLSSASGRGRCGCCSRASSQA